MAALNMRSQPGQWKGEKGARVASAALGAVVGDVFSKGKGGRDGDGGGDRRGRDDRDRGREDRDRDRDRGRGGERGKSQVEALGDVLGGFIADKWAKRAR